MKTILPIMTSTNTDISIRLIDWFVTNYSKKMNVVYKVSNKEEPIVVWQDYKSQLKGWSKKFFDPFCRRERILFKYKDGNQTNEIMTTLGQLNFFRWAIENKIPTSIFFADWETHGKSAGFIRNHEIIKNCDKVIAFWDGVSKGTGHSITLCSKYNKPYKIIPI
jgi:hypothetical protein